MNKEQRVKQIRKQRRTKRSRSKILARKTRVRLTVFRSNRYIYVQVVDDKTGKTLLSASEKELDGQKLNKTEKAKLVGKKLAETAKKKKIISVVFDKGPYKFHGRIKALAQGAQEGGLEF